jgi:hypothetical protein
LLQRRLWNSVAAGCVWGRAPWSGAPDVPPPRNTSRSCHCTAATLGVRQTQKVGAGPFAMRRSGVRIPSAPPKIQARPTTSVGPESFLAPAHPDPARLVWPSPGQGPR